MKAYLREALRPAQLAIAFLCVSVGLTVLQLRPWLIATAEKSTATVDLAGRAMTNLDSASLALKTAANDESRYLELTLPQFTTRIEGTLDDANAILSSLRGTAGKLDTLADSANQVLTSTRTQVDALAPVIDQTRQSVQGLQPLEADLDAVIKDPDIPKTIYNVQQATKRVSGTTADVQQAVHAYLHPTWAQKVKNFLLNTGVEVGKFFF